MSTSSPIASPTPVAATPAASAAATRPEFTDIGDPTKIASQSLSFHDLLSAINPLQHIPVVGTIYRAITGDTIVPAARVLGGALLGGPIGLITAAADAIFEQSTGKDVATTALAAVGINSDAPSAPAAQYAAASTPDDNKATPADGKDSAAASVLPAASTPASESSAAGSSVAPASRAVAGAPAPLPAGAAAAGAPAGSPPLAVGAKPSGAGWTLADYQTFAGHGMPAAANSPVRNAVVPLQTTVPIGNEIGQAAIVPAVARQPAMAAIPASASSSDSPASSGSPDNWMAQAMMRGLDRYREMKKIQDQGPQPSIVGSF